jgi:hypothetical protein
MQPLRPEIAIEDWRQIVGRLEGRLLRLAAR